MYGFYRGTSKQNYLRQLCERAMLRVFETLRRQRIYMHPGDGFQSTQIPARQFFDGVWKSRSESFALITIGAIGLAVYRHGDVAYVFDPHGHGSVTEAFVVRVLARDVYAYLTGYAATDPESDWAGALVFLLRAVPPRASPAF